MIEADVRRIVGTARSVIAGALVTAIVLALRGFVSAREEADVTYRAEVESWRAKHEAGLRADDGWLSVAGLFFLEEGESYKIGSAPGSAIPLPADAAPPLAATVERSRGRVFVTLAAGVYPKLNDDPAPEAFEMRPARTRPGTPADRLQIGRLTLLVHTSGPRIAIRLRDPESPFRRGFAGLRWFPVDERWRVVARFLANPRPRRVQLRNVLGDITVYSSSGEAEFSTGGRTVRLQAWDSGDRLWFVFRDRSAGQTTYGIRQLYAHRPRGKRVVLDFNRSYNLPCAYNPYTTCPLPPPENVLEGVEIPAGEQLYEPAAKIGGSEGCGRDETRTAPCLIAAR